MEDKTEKQTVLLIKEAPTTTIYCNQAQMGISLWDITIDIGQTDMNKIAQSDDGKQILPVEYKAHIVMSPQHAKAFSIMFSENIIKYEQEFGEINIQPKKA